MGERRVLLVVGHPLLRQAIRQLLNNIGPELLDEATDIVDGVYLAVSQQPTFIILDTSIVEVSGSMFGELIHKLAPQSRIVLLVDDGHEYRETAQEQGAICVSKRTVALELPQLAHRWLCGL
ncbi:MAG: response regulator [Chloroflexi bacterium]|nr:response regulator [Chloroflexota bacterium]